VARRRQPVSQPGLPFEELTYSVSELCAEVRKALRAAAPRWVVGEVQRVRRSRAGHLYLELIEKGQGDQVVGKLEAVIWRRDLQQVERNLRASGQEITDGLEIRCCGDLDFYAPFGRLQLVVREVDSVFLLGQLSLRRQETLQALEKAGLLGKNRELQLPPVPLDLALVTSDDSAAYHDFLATLAESEYGFRVHFIHAAVQGRAAEGEVASALAVAGNLGVACTVLIRGGGSKTDLAAFDSRQVSEAVARSPVPVITGLGHEIDLSIADQVAHTRTKTPTQAAALLVQKVRSSEQDLARLGDDLQRASGQLLLQARSGLAGVEGALRVAAHRVQSWATALDRLGELLQRSARRRLDLEVQSMVALRVRLAMSAPRIVGRGEQILQDLGRRAVSTTRGRVDRARVDIEALGRLCTQLGPERTLARGFSITRDARGRVVSARNQVGVGDRIETEMAHGRLTSVVEE
jgi:exodeoxyribonuclease VII large subunit